MSEIKFNLIDHQQLINGTMHFGVADRSIAALSVDPETIHELDLGLSRFQKLDEPFFSAERFKLLEPSVELLDVRPCEAGILIIDLAARVVVCDTTYFEIYPKGSIEYHDGTSVTDLLIPFWLADDWLITRSVDEYRSVRAERCQQRQSNPPFDARPVLYGRPLLEFIAENALQFSLLNEAAHNLVDDCDPVSGSVTAIHALWLMTKRDDLRGYSPREVILARHDFIDFDLESRCVQWSFQLVGPPCIPRDSNAYKFGGFGTNEWVIYYDLVRHLIWKGFGAIRKHGAIQADLDLDKLIGQLEEIKTTWLTEPNDDLAGRIPFIVIDNERKRLPEAMGGRSMVIDEDCPICHAMGDESEAGLGVWFWHLDGCNMDEGFAFSSHLSVQEWEAEQRDREDMHHKFEQEFKEREERMTRGEVVEDDSLFKLALDEYCVPALPEPEIPEA